MSEPNAATPGAESGTEKAPTEKPPIHKPQRVLRSGESAEPLPGEGRPSLWPVLKKVIGYGLLSIVLAIGVAVVGDMRFESIGSALIGVLILLLVIGSSGLTGFWNPKG